MCTRIPVSSHTRKGLTSMRQRETNLLWLKDILEQLQHARQQLAYAEDPNTIALVTETMLRELERGRRLCEELRCRSPLRTAS